MFKGKYDYAASLPLCNTTGCQCSMNHQLSRLDQMEGEWGRIPLEPYTYEQDRKVVKKPKVVIDLTTTDMEQEKAPQQEQQQSAVRIYLTAAADMEVTQTTTTHTQLRKCGASSMPRTRSKSNNSLRNPRCSPSSSPGSRPFWMKRRARWVCVF